MLTLEHDFLLNVNVFHVFNIALKLYELIGRNIRKL